MSEVSWHVVILQTDTTDTSPLPRWQAALARDVMDGKMLRPTQRPFPWVLRKQELKL